MKGWVGLISLLMAGTFVWGCAVYTPKEIHAVEQMLRDAEAAGAKKKAAYEYYSALEHLRIAKEELTEGDDKNAKDFGEKAKAMAEKALQKSK